MQYKFARRGVLRSASGLVAATALGGLIDSDAVASEELPAHTQDDLTPNHACMQQLRAVSSRPAATAS